MCNIYLVGFPKHRLVLKYFHLNNLSMDWHPLADNRSYILNACINNEVGVIESNL